MKPKFLCRGIADVPPSGVDDYVEGHDKETVQLALLPSSSKYHWKSPGLRLPEYACKTMRSQKRGRGHWSVGRQGVDEEARS